jgi:urease accessory protein
MRRFSAKPFLAPTIALVLTAASASSAAAHTLDAQGAGFAQGFAHPFGGIDHLLAMVAVGLWAAQRGGRALWAVPASFVGMMAMGGIAGAFGLTLPLVELAVALSLVALGLAVALSIRLPVALFALLVGLFALFHGHAHGSELPEAASALSYGLGFIAATAALHGIGVATGLLLKRDAGRVVVRLGGAGIAATGLILAATL